MTKKRTRLAAGVDGCRAGWIQISRDQTTGETESRCFGDAAAFLVLVGSQGRRRHI